LSIRRLLDSELSGILTENVFGNSAIVYHRTPVNPDKFGKGFHANDAGKSMAATAGNGVYFFDSFKRSLINEDLGRYQIKAKISLIDFIILDIDTAKTVYGNDYLVVDQLISIADRHRVDINRIMNDNFFIHMKKYEMSDRVIKKEVVDYLSKSLFNSKIFRKLVNGIFANSSEFGKYGVCYNPSLLIPISWRDAMAYKEPKKLRDKMVRGGSYDKSNAISGSKEQNRNEVFDIIDKNESDYISRDIGKVFGDVIHDTHKINLLKGVIKNEDVNIDPDKIVRYLSDNMKINHDLFRLFCRALNMTTDGSVDRINNAKVSLLSQLFTHDNPELLTIAEEEFNDDHYSKWVKNNIDNENVGSALKAAFGRN